MKKKKNNNIKIEHRNLRENEIKPEKK